MVAQIFAVIELLLKLVGLWEQFQSWNEAKKIAEAEEKRQKREKAIDELDKAESDEDIFNKQTDIVNNKP